MAEEFVSWRNVFVTAMDGGDFHQGSERLARKAMCEFRASGGMCGWCGPFATEKEADYPLDEEGHPVVGLDVEEIDWTGFDEEAP